MNIDTPKEIEFEWVMWANALKFGRICKKIKESYN